MKNPQTEVPIEFCIVSKTKPIRSTIIAYSMTVAPAWSCHSRLQMEFIRSILAASRAALQQRGFNLA
jgi:hypothetical protein